MTDDKEIGERLRQARKAAGYPTVGLAAKSLGIAYPTYAAHENGSRGVVRAVEKYAKKFRVSLDWLLTGRGDPPKQKSQILPPWKQMIQEAIEAAREEQVPAGEMHEYFGRILFSSLPDNVQQSTGLDREAEQIFEGFAEREALPLRSSSNDGNQGNERRQKPRPSRRRSSLPNSDPT